MKNPSARDRDALAGAREETRPPVHDHVVQFYDEASAVIQAAGSFLAGGLTAGAPALVIARTDRLPSFRLQLRDMGVDVESALRMSQLRLLDARETLDSFMAGGMPSDPLFRSVVGSLVASTTEVWRPARLHMYGEMVDMLWGEGNPAAAIALEELWNDLAHRYGFALHCAYSAGHFVRDEHRLGFDAVCRQHGRIVGLPADPSALA